MRILRIKKQLENLRDSHGRKFLALCHSIAIKSLMRQRDLRFLTSKYFLLHRKPYQWFSLYIVLVDCQLLNPFLHPSPTHSHSGFQGGNNGKSEDRRGGKTQAFSPVPHSCCGVPGSVCVSSVFWLQDSGNTTCSWCLFYLRGGRISYSC